MKWWRLFRRPKGGKVGAPPEKHHVSGVLHHAEGIVPDGKGGLLHWQDTGDGIEWTDVDPAEWGGGRVSGHE